MSKIMKNRRTFFKDLLRYFSLGAITFTGAKMVTRKPSPENQVCINKSICKDCQTFSACELPRALSIKDFMKRQNKDG